MRSLTDTLLAEQKKGLRDVLWKIVLTNNGDSYTYKKDRVKVIFHVEGENKGIGQVLLDNTDKVFTSLKLKGFQGIFSFGCVTPAGDEYSPTAPLWVLSQDTFSLETGQLFCQLNLGGLLNLLNADEATEVYEPASTNTDTIKTIFNAICGATLAPYTRYSAITVVWDSEDSIVDSFIPKNYFRISLNESRLSALKKLLGWTGLVMRPEHDGKLHVFVPRVDTSTAWQATTAYSLRDEVIPTTANGYVYICTTAGTSDGTEPTTWKTGIGDTVIDGTVVWTVAYHYQYELATDDEGKHTFFDKSYRERIVTPNYQVVQSHSGDSPSYTGNAQTSDYATLPANLKQQNTLELPLVSNAQATSIAEAKITKRELDAQRGSVRVPMNVGQEVYDFPYIIDEREGDARNGTIKTITRRCNADQRQFEMTLDFGLLADSPTTFMMPSNLNLIGGSGEMNFQLLVDQMMQLQGQISDIWGFYSEQHELLKGIITLLENLLASIAETSAGAILLKAVTPYGLANSTYGARVLVFPLNGSVALTTDDKAYIRIPLSMDGFKLTRAAAMVKGASSSGDITLTVKNGATNMLSVGITIDAGEYDTLTAVTQPVVDTDEDDVSTGDQIEVAVTGAGAGVTYCVVELSFTKDV